MKFLNKMNQLVLFCILMLSAYTFAQPPAEDLQDSLTADSLHADSLSKISLTLDVDTSNAVDTNKVEHVDAGIKKNSYCRKGAFSERLCYGNSLCSTNGDTSPFFRNA